MLINFHLTSKESRAHSNLFSNSISAALRVGPRALSGKKKEVRYRGVLKSVPLSVKGEEAWGEKVEGIIK